MTRYKDNRFCEYVFCADDIWKKDGETLVQCWPENDANPPYFIRRKYLTEAPIDFGACYR